MTFQQLTYVVEISKCGSINKAAHKLVLSQSGISTAMRELEEELGIQFFVRSNRGVEFTPEGKEFLSYAVSLLEQKQRIERLYETRDTAAPARFSVSTQRYPFTEDAFLRMLDTAGDSRFHFSIKETGMDAVIDDVYDHRSDVGVIFLTELTEKMMRKREAASGTQADIHEQDKAYLRRCRENANEVARLCGWTVIRWGRDGAPRTIEDIQGEVWEQVRTLL